MNQFVPLKEEYYIESMAKINLNKFGIKIYFSCDKKTSHILDLQICGEKKTLNDMVISMIKPFSSTSHIPHIDNYYNRPKLSLKLLKLDIHTNGTIRNNRGISKQLIDYLPSKYNTKYFLIEDYIYS